MNPEQVNALVRPYQDQAVSIRSIVALGFDALSPLASTPAALSGPVAGIDLLLFPAERAEAMVTPPGDGLPYRAVVAFRTAETGPARDGWKLQRSLFDRGLVCIGALPLAGGTAHCFLAADSIRSMDGIATPAPRGRITMATLGQNGRFANQLFQYAFARLYALRHGLSAAFPDWEGRHLYGLDDPSCDGLVLPRLSFEGFSVEDRLLWDRDEPPVDVDLWGYFQEIPACWQHQRPLLRCLFRLPEEQERAFDGWRDQVTDGGARTLVAIHVRRGDYRKSQFDLPHFSLVPEQWYLDWLRALWPTLRNPMLYVATDEPEVIRPAFAEFEAATETFGPVAAGLPAHVRDFEVLRRADQLALCNSSFSRMAAVLAPPTQRCYLPSFQAQAFSPYEPWIDPAFWERFGEWPPHAAGHAGQAVSIIFDVSDLVPYLINHATLTGIQRVQCELLRNLHDIPHRPSVRLAVLVDGDDLREVDGAALLQILDDIAAGSSTRSVVVAGLRALLSQATPCTLRRGDTFLLVGAFWPVRGMGRQLQQLKHAGVIIGALIHDLLPIDAPEFFESGATRVFAKGAFEVLTFADFIVTTSQYNRLSLVRLMATRGFRSLPIALVPLAREQAQGAFRGADVSSAVQRILASDYVLCVGTIEVRKNPGYLFHLWRLMLEAGRPDIPYLVFAGRTGWLVRDFIDQLDACRHLGGKVVLVHDASDYELDLLYRNCLLTMFPSFAEGWGLPVGESLAHGKVCLCAATGGVPDVGGVAADYIDPYDLRDGLSKLTRYLDDPDLRRRRERDIVSQFTPRTWRSVADDFLRSAVALARDVPDADGIVAVRLPPEQYLPVGNGRAALLLDAIDGAHSAELACTSGWHPAEGSGARAQGRTATVQFRVDAPVGAAVVLVMRLAAHGRRFHLAIRSESGAAINVTMGAGTERVAVLSCRVEPGQLVTAQLSSDAAPSPASRWGRARYFSLGGILYFQPQHLTPAAMRRMLHGAQADLPPASMPPPAAPQPREAAWASDRHAILLSSRLSMDERRRAPSLRDFLHSTNAWWPSEYTARLHAPLVADDADRRLFVAGCANGPHASLLGRDEVKLTRRSDVFVSMARMSEGSIFDRSGVWRAMGYLQGMPRDALPAWLSNVPGGVRIDAQALAAAPCYDVSCLMFYNGNLHNYYHWLAEGLLGLDVLAQALGPDADVRIALPRSMDLHAVFDHRRTLDDVGLGGSRVIEIPEDLIRVREAIWVDSDLVQNMPAPYLRAFQQRVARLHAGARAATRRRVLVARRGPARMIANLAQVEGLLASAGFETVYLEGMGMAEQIRLFQGAEFIVGPHGAGLANLLFCEPGTRVIEFMPTAEFRSFFWVISQKLGLVHGVQFCPTTHGSGFQGALEVDIGKLQALVGAVDAAAARTTPAGAAARRLA